MTRESMSKDTINHNDSLVVPAEAAVVVLVVLLSAGAP